MRPTFGVVRLALCLSSLAPLAAAWPSWLPDVDSLVVRQNDEPSQTSSSPAEETSPSSGNDENNDDSDSTLSENPPEETNNSDNQDDGGDSMNTARPSGTHSAGSSQTQSINPNDAAGGVSMLTPATTIAPTPLFKIGDYATLGWNYTSLQVTPDAIDVLISCSKASETWTLTGNMSFETAVNYVWNTDDQANDAEAPLLTELYTLIIKEADADITDLPSPGHLGVYSQFTFGLYYPAQYTPLGEWECTACNAAMPGFDSRAVGFAFTMCIVTVLSFTWYVTGLGAF